MTKSIADLYNEVQNIANGNRRLDLAGQWEHAATPGNIAFDATNNEYMRNVEESQLKQQENRAQYIKNNYKKEVAVAAPVPGPAPIPVMNQPQLTRIKTVKEEQMTKDNEQIDEVVAAADLAKSGLTLGQYMNKQRGLTAVKGGRNDVASSSAPKTNTPGTQGVATGKSFAEIDRNRKVTAQDKPATPPAAPKPLGGTKWSDQGARERSAAPAAQSSTIKSSGGEAPVAAPKVAPTPPTRPSMAKESTNPLIASFLALQETKHSNMFEAAKKKNTAQAEKYNNGDKDEIDDKGARSATVANSQAPGAVAENAQLPGHRRLSMFDPTQGYARTAGSADGAKERLEALWGAVTGQQTVHREAGLADAIRADLAAIKEEFGDMFNEEISAISEALESIVEAPTKKDHSLAAMAAAAISRGHPVKKLPAGRAENAVLPKGMYGGGINHESGVKRQAKMRSEDVEQVDEISKKAYVNAVSSKTNYYDDDRAGNPSKIIDRAKKYHGDKFAKDLEGVNKDRNRTYGTDKLAAKTPVRVTKSGMANKSDLAYRKRSMQKEELFSEEEIAYIQSVLEGNPVAGTASVEGSPSSAQAARGSQLDKATLTDSKKKF